MKRGGEEEERKKESIDLRKKKIHLKSKKEMGRKSRESIKTSHLKII